MYLLRYLLHVHVYNCTIKVLSLIVATTSYSTVATVGIAVGIAAVVIICTVIVTIVIVLAVRRRRNAERKKQLNESTMKRHVYAIFNVHCKKNYFQN